MSYDQWKAEVLARPGARERVNQQTENIRAAQELAQLRRSRGLTQKEAARLMGVSQPRIAQIESASNLTTELIETYAHLLGGRVRVTIEADVGDEQVTAVERNFPRNIAVKRGWFASMTSTDPHVNARMLLRRLDQGNRPIAARRANEDVAFTTSQLAWVARILDLAEGLKVEPYNPTAVDSYAKELASLEPEELALVPEKLARCGVIALMEEHLPGSKLDGVALLRGDGTPVIALTNRGKRFDVLLWTILHELAHVWRGHLHTVSIAIDEDLGTSDRPAREQEADNQARLWLFPEQFAVPHGRLEVSDVQRLSRQYNVHPSVIAGQILRKDRNEYRRLSKYLDKVPLGVWDPVGFATNGTPHQ
jgi:transcriptional regulator with XRE-family HTH domain